jgi:diguanylate cyclase (GGDEF)-like protein
MYLWPLNPSSRGLSMKLRSRVILILIAIWATICLGFLLDVKFILKNSYLRLEEKIATKNMHRVEKALESSFESLELYTISFSQWDDAYDFMKTKSEKFIKSNFVAGTFTSSSINYYLYFDNQSRLFYGKAFKLSLNDFIPIPDELLNYVNVNSFLLKPSTITTKHTGIIRMPSSYAVISIVPVLDSEGRGPARGTILMGYNLNERHINRLADTVELKLQLISLPMKQPYDHATIEAYARLLKGEPIVWTPFNSTLSYGYILLKDMDGNPAAILRAEIPREVYMEGVLTLTHYLLVLAILSILILVATALLLKIFVLDRIFRMNKQITEINTRGQFHRRLEIPGNDEISSVATSMNALLELIQQNHDQLHSRISQGKKDVEKLAKFNKNLFSELSSQKAVELKLREDEKTLKKLAYYDHLTGLPNRALFIALLQQAKVNADASKTKIAVMFVDIDNFKKINDTYGHDFGDKFIRHTAQSLRQVLREDDVASRLSGDEFMVFCPNMRDDQSVNAAAEKILAQLTETVIIDKTTIKPAYSIGISIYPTDADNITELFKQADLAMYHAKREHGNLYCYFRNIKYLIS